MRSETQRGGTFISFNEATENLFGKSIRGHWDYAKYQKEYYILLSNFSEMEAMARPPQKEENTQEKVLEEKDGENILDF